jgi:hypothetical protein
MFAAPLNLNAFLLLGPKPEDSASARAALSAASPPSHRPVSLVCLARAFRAQGHAKRHHCQAQCGDCDMKALADPAVRSRIVDLGNDVFPREEQTPGALGALQKADAAKWWPII